MKVPYGVRLDQSISITNLDLLADHVNFAWIRGGTGAKGIDSKYIDYVNWARINQIPYGIYFEVKVDKNPKMQAQFAASFRPAPLGFGAMFAEVVFGNKTETLNVFSKYIKFFGEATGGLIPTIITNASTWDYKPRTDWAKYLPLYSASWGRSAPKNPLDWSGIKNPVQEYFWEFDAGAGVIGLVGTGTMLPQIRFSPGFEKFNKVYGLNSAPIVALPEMSQDPTPPPPPPPVPGSPELKPGDRIEVLVNLNARGADGSDQGRILAHSIAPVEAVETDRVKVSFFLPRDPAYIKRTEEV